MRHEPSVDALLGEALRAGEDAGRAREFLLRSELDESVLVALLRRALPVRLLELTASTPPWSDRPLVLGAVVANPRTPRTLALRLLPALHWRDLAVAAGSARLQTAVRTRAEALLKERLPELRLGDRIALGRMATPPVLVLLLADEDTRVVQGTLENPRLREEDLRRVLRDASVSRGLIEQTAACSRWRDVYGVRLELVLQPRTPLGVALSQLSSLVTRDLRRVSETSELAPLVRAAARRVAGRAP